MRKTPAQLAAMKALAFAACEIATLIAEDLEDATQFEQQERDRMPEDAQSNQLAGAVMSISQRVEQLGKLLASIDTLHKV